jgi:hypothetical protein
VLNSAPSGMKRNGKIPYPTSLTMLSNRRGRWTGSVSGRHLRPTGERNKFAWQLIPSNPSDGWRPARCRCHRRVGVLSGTG